MEARNEKTSIAPCNQRTVECPIKGLNTIWALIHSRKGLYPNLSPLKQLDLLWWKYDHAPNRTSVSVKIFINGMYRKNKRLNSFKLFQMAKTSRTGIVLLLATAPSGSSLRKAQWAFRQPFGPVFFSFRSPATCSCMSHSAGRQVQRKKACPFRSRQAFNWAQNP